MKSVKVGILGDGQLAKMLVEAAYPLGITTFIYSDSTHTALSQLCPQIVRGSRNDPKSLSKFLSSVDVVVYESEFFERKHVEAAAKSCKNGVLFFPELSTMEILRDKLEQKKILRNLKIPTSDFVELKEDHNIKSWLENVQSKFKKGYVLKWGQLGYDGKGVFFPTIKDKQTQIDFCEKARQFGVSLFAEEKINFKRELAITACFSTKKEFCAYPLVISIQKDGICTQVLGPATSLGVQKKMETKAQSYAEKLARELNLYGCFSIELFERGGNELLVNEIAPRVHNSAHYSQDGALTSQFENHLRAVLGLPLGGTDCVPFFTMVNLLGPTGVESSNEQLPRPIPKGGLHLHWYGKDQVKPGRKIGHINGAALNFREKAKVLSEMKKCLGDWQSRCQKESHK